MVLGSPRISLVMRMNEGEGLKSRLEPNCLKPRKLFERFGLNPANDREPRKTSVTGE